MEQWLREALAEEQGYIICPLAPETYTICNENCKECEYEKDFIKALKEKGGCIVKTADEIEVWKDIKRL